MLSPSEPPKPGTVIYRPWRRKPDGTIIYAKTYGKKVFRIVLGGDEKPNLTK